MKRKKLDITGKTSPYCLSVVAKEAKALKPSDELLITCNNFPAATTSIPRIAREEDLSLEVQKPSSDRWEIRLTRK
jgi:TusA-related sulfurtransferase